MKEESATALLREAEEVTPLYHSTADARKREQWNLTVDMNIPAVAGELLTVARLNV
jgi:hypothetical protein